MPSLQGCMLSSQPQPLRLYGTFPSLVKDFASVFAELLEGSVHLQTLEGSPKLIAFSAAAFLH